MTLLPVPASPLSGSSREALPGLVPAFQKQAIRWAQRMSGRFLLEEEPVTQETEQRANHFLQIAREYWKQGVQSRDSFYMRHGRRNAPAAGMWKPHVPPLAPRR